MKETILIGTFTKKYGDIGQKPGEMLGDGIYQYEMEVETLNVELVHTYHDYDNPAYLDVSGDKLYAVSEMAADSKISVMAYQKETGRYVHSSTKQLEGAGSCHVTVWPEGNALSIANYGSGSVLVVPLEEDGSFKEAFLTFQHQGKGVNPARQEGPHAHSTLVAPGGHFLLAADLGLDLVKQYRVAENGIFPYPQADIAVEAGEGPRHMCFSPDGKTLYLVTEMGNHVYCYSYDPETGSHTLLKKVGTLPESWTGESTAAGIQLSSDGRFLYVSNRGADTIAVYSVAEDGALKMIGNQDCGGKTPRSFGISPSGTYLVVANQDSDNVVIFKRNRETGLLEEKTQEFTVGKPVCVVITGESETAGR